MKTQAGMTEESSGRWILLRMGSDRMATFMLGCGPYFHEEGLVGAIILFLLVKPLAYFAFIQAFRYRVSRPIPMRTGQAVKLAALRAGLGIALVGLGTVVLLAYKNEQLLFASWGFLYVERLFSWWLVGWRGAGLKGRRLVGWIISGTMINGAFDAAVVWGLMEGPLPQVGLVSAIAIFIGALHIIGRRDSLKARFRNDICCAMCQYDLTGNLSGRCPECGHALSDGPSDQAALA
jgi:hypothetical protein